MSRDSIRAVMWFVCSLITSVANDSITKLLNNSISASTVSFWRFAFSTAILIPVILFSGLKSIRTNRIHYHILRGGILALAMSLWAYGIKFVPISTVTLMSFTVPMFTILMASVFLKEKISNGTILATIIGFAGSVFTISPGGINFSLISVVFIIASVLFASLDIINKELLNSGEKTVPMLFYSNLFSATFALFVPGVELSLDLYELILLFILGLGANLILFFIVKAFSIAKASFLAPVRYLELVISTLVGLIVFGEGISLNILIGGGMIILSSILIDVRFKLDGHKKRL